MRLPGTARPLPPIGLGCMALSLRGRPSREDALAVVRRAVESGIRLLDTADVYAADDGEIGHNERLIAEALAAMGIRADDPDSGVVVATKGGRTRRGEAWGHDARPERLREACEESLRALSVERIPLYQLHAPDPAVPLVESVGELGRLAEEGKVEAIGLSNVTVDQIDEARSVAPVAAVQNPLSPWDVRRRPGTVVSACESRGMVFLAYAPLGGRTRAGLLAECAPLRAVADTLGCAPAELALAVLRSEAEGVVPLVGASRPSTVDGAARAAALRPDAESLRAARRALRSLPGRPSLARKVLSRLLRAVS